MLLMTEEQADLLQLFICDQGCGIGNKIYISQFSSVATGEREKRAAMCVYGWSCDAHRTHD